MPKKKHRIKQDCYLLGQCQCDVCPYFSLHSRVEGLCSIKDSVSKTVTQLRLANILINNKIWFKSDLHECQPCVHGREASAHILLGGVWMQHSRADPWGRGPFCPCTKSSAESKSGPKTPGQLPHQLDWEGSSPQYDSEKFQFIDLLVWRITRFLQRFDRVI